MDSFTKTALKVLETSSLTPTELIQTLLRSETKTFTLDNIEFTVKGHVNIHLFAKSKGMNEAISIFWISDH
jgi:hypothetical protein